MAYGSKNGRKPFERASKIAHGEIINNPQVTGFLKGCTLPSAPAPPELLPRIHTLQPAEASHLRVVVAIDGGFTETYVQEGFPSASITYFTFGPLLFRLADLRHLDIQRFIAPEDLAALKKLQRFTLVLPTRGIRLTGLASLASSIRKTLFDFFTQPSAPSESPLIDTLRWFLFRRWEPTPDETRAEVLAHCPNPQCTATNLSFHYTTPATYPCPSCGTPLYLTDMFRLHERIDEDQGAGGIQVYVMTLLEQMVLLHVIRSIWTLKRSLLGEIFFIKDGPLAFFGTVAPLYKPMRELTYFLLQQPGPGGRMSLLYLAGVEKSGAFVEHAAAIASNLSPATFLLPDNDYIYRYIVPGDPAAGTYGQNTYYGGKVIFKGAAGDMYVLTVPTLEDTSTPEPSHFPNLDMILQVITELRCNMYENALVPVALANKLVSLSDFPSQRILTTFTRQEIG